MNFIDFGKSGKRARVGGISQGKREHEEIQSCFKYINKQPLRSGWSIYQLNNQIFLCFENILNFSFKSLE